MRRALTISATLASVTCLVAGAAPGLGAPQAAEAGFPRTLVGRWSRTVTHAAWVKYGRDFPTTKVAIEVDTTGMQVGYYGPDFAPNPAPSGNTFPDWYTEWKVAGGKVTIGAVPPCGWIDSFTGRYRWNVAGKALTITKIADKCGDRTAVFAGRWTRK